MLPGIEPGSIPRMETERRTGSSLSLRSNSGLFDFARSVNRYVQIRRDAVESRQDLHHHQLAQFGGAIASKSAAPGWVVFHGAPSTLRDGLGAVIEDDFPFLVTELSCRVVLGRGWTVQGQICRFGAVVALVHSAQIYLLVRQASNDDNAAGFLVHALKK